MRSAGVVLKRIISAPSDACARFASIVMPFLRVGSFAGGRGLGVGKRGRHWRPGGGRQWPGRPGAAPRTSLMRAHERFAATKVESRDEKERFQLNEATF